jgi:hypothetical protein
MPCHTEIDRSVGKYLDDAGERQDRYGNECRAEGCGRPLYENGKAFTATGRGYCSQHYMSWRRHGTPISPREARRQELREAAIAYADEPTKNTRRDLCMKALSCHVMWERGHDPGLNFEMMLCTRPAERMCAVAFAWAEFDAEAPLADYLAAEEELYAQAHRFAGRWRSLNFDMRQSAPVQAPVQVAVAA